MFTRWTLWTRNKLREYVQEFQLLACGKDSASHGLGYNLQNKMPRRWTGERFDPEISSARTGIRMQVLTEGKKDTFLWFHRYPLDAPLGGSTRKVLKVTKEGP